MGSKRNVIIDTGLNRKECLDTMQTGLHELHVDLGETDFFITHLHADHFGLVSRLATATSKIYFNHPDAEILKVWGRWEAMILYAGQNGFPKDALNAALKSHPAYKFHSEVIPELSILKENDTITLGDYLFQCIVTPGHTRGHTCLYEPTKKILISGDHILNDITPTIQCWSDQDNPLKNYLTSLNKVYKLDVALVLPGHRRLFRNHRERIAELKKHHRNRAKEVLQILNKGPMNAFQVASEMTWDITYESWEQFPVTQKWFATGEAIAHLRYLERKDMLLRKTEGDVTLFSLN
jgi:glyoxylase-like metal-dependent hydrolase (beta-lactamase superfamily II)